MREQLRRGIILALTGQQVAAAATTHRYGSVTAAQLFRRQNDNQCAEASFRPCDNANLPDNFCCPANTQCIPLDGDKSMICCPAGSDCRFIQPITCDISLQNATEHPRNPVQNTDLSGELPKCGNACCPQGFSCADGQCKMDEDQGGARESESESDSASTTARPPSSASSSAKVTLTTPASTSLPSTTAAAAAAATNSDEVGAATQSPSSDDPRPTSPSSNGFPAKAVLAGFFPGMLLGGLIVLGIFLCLMRRKKKISAPIYQTNGGDNLRTDFLRRTPPRASSRPRLSRPSILPGRHPHGSPSSAGAGSAGARTPLFRALSSRRRTGGGGNGNGMSKEMEMAKHQSESASVDVDFVLADPLPPMPSSNAAAYGHGQGTTVPIPNPYARTGAAASAAVAAGAGPGIYGPTGYGPPGGAYINNNINHQQQQQQQQQQQWPSPSNYSSTPGQLHPPPSAGGGGGGGGGGAGFLNPHHKERGVSQMTAFTDLMETAGFKKGEPFLANATMTTGTGKRR